MRFAQATNRDYSWPPHGGNGLTLRVSESVWTTLQLRHIGDNGQRYFDQGDGSILVAGYAPTKFAAVFQSHPLDLKGITAIRLELLNDPNLPCNGPGRSFMGTCALTEISVEAINAAKPNEKVAVKLASATADYGYTERVLEANFLDKTEKRRVTGPVEFAIDGKDETAWGIDAGPGRRNQPRNAVCVFDKPVGHENGTVLKITLKQNHGGWNSDDHMNNNLGRLRLSATTAEMPLADSIPAAVRSALSVSRERRSPTQQAAIFRIGERLTRHSLRSTIASKRCGNAGRAVSAGFPEFLQVSASHWALAPGQSALTDEVRGLTRIIHGDIEA